MKELKMLVQREYIKALKADLDEMDLTDDEKDIIFADMCNKAGIDLRLIVLG